MMYKIANETPPPPTAHNEALLPEVVRISERGLERGLEKDAEKRYPGGNEVAAELRQVIPRVGSGRSARGSS